MTPLTVLTDAQIRQVMSDTPGEVERAWLMRFARAIERATVAALRQTRGEPSEARALERERMAFEAGVKYGAHIPPAHNFGVVLELAHAEALRRYPAPAPDTRSCKRCGMTMNHDDRWVGQWVPEVSEVWHASHDDCISALSAKVAALAAQVRQEGR